MNFLEIANELIPGYGLLSDKNRAYVTVNCPNFFQLITGLLKQSTSLGVIKEMKPVLMQFIHQQGNEYQTIQKLVIKQLLFEYYSDFKWLTAQQRSFFIETLFSRQAHAELTALGCLTRLKGVIKKWCETVYRTDSAETIACKKTVVQKKCEALAERARKLSSFFPLLWGAKFQERKRSRGYDVICDGYVRKFIEIDKETPFMTMGRIYLEMDSFETQVLSEWIYCCLSQETKNHLPHFSMHDFNLEQANDLAVRIVGAFNQGKTKPRFVQTMQEWFESYEKKSWQHLAMRFQTRPENEETQSGLWKAITDMREQFKKTLDDIADAHGFFQAIGFASHSDSWQLSWMDMFNYWRYHGVLNENKTTLFNLFAVFNPLVQEYRELSKQKNDLLKVFKALIPMVVVSLVLLGVFSLLTPLAIPELALTLIAIPTLVFGLALASQYVLLKNYTYQWLHQWWYGGAFEIPEFSVNARMTKALGGRDNALNTRAFYIEELRRLEKKEAKYHPQLDRLTDKQIEKIEAIKKEKQSLLLEWFNIHSNREFGINNIPTLLLNRLRYVKHREERAQDKAFQNEDTQDNMKQCIHDMVSALKRKFLQDSLWAEGLRSAPKQWAVKDRRDKFFKHHLTLTQTTSFESDIFSVLSSSC